jgi:hypothetical protein
MAVVNLVVIFLVLEIVVLNCFESPTSAVLCYRSLGKTWNRLEHSDRIRIKDKTVTLLDTCELAGVSECNLAHI